MDNSACTQRPWFLTVSLMTNHQKFSVLIVHQKVHCIRYIGYKRVNKQRMYSERVNTRAPLEYATPPKIQRHKYNRQIMVTLYKYLNTQGTAVSASRPSSISSATVTK